MAKRGDLMTVRPDIRVLDATLRDGGLVNNFNFISDIKDLANALKTASASCIVLILFPGHVNINIKLAIARTVFITMYGFIFLSLIIINIANNKYVNQQEKKATVIEANEAENRFEYNGRPLPVAHAQCLCPRWNDNLNG